MSLAEVDAAVLDARLDAVGALLQNSPSDAAVELDSICRSADQAGLAELAGHANYLAARARLNLGELDEAFARIDIARQRFVSADCHLDAARTGLGRMNVLDDLGRHDEAIEVGRSLLVDLAAFETPGDPNITRMRAAALENIGVSNGTLGRHDDALAAYNEAERMYSDASLEVDASRCAANRGVELVEIGRPSESLAILRSSSDRFVGDGDLLFAGLCVAYEAKAQMQCGDYTNAEERLTASDRLLCDLDATTEWARAQLVRAETLVSLNLLDDAAALYELLETRFTESGLRHDAAHAGLGIANTLLLLGDADAARRSLERAELLAAELGDEPMVAACLLGLSFCVEPSRQLDAARDAVAHFSAVGRGADEAIARMRLVELGDDRSAEHLARCDELVSNLAVPHVDWQLHRSHALALRRAGDDATALVRLRRAAVIVEELRDTVATRHALVPFMGSRRQVHEDLVETLLDMGDTASAYAEVGVARARTLKEASGSNAAALTNAATAVVYEVLDDEIVAFVDCAGAEVGVVRSITNVRAVDRVLNRLGAQWRHFDADVGLDAQPDVAVANDLLGQLHDLLIAPLDLDPDVSELLIVPIGALANVPFAALFDGSTYMIDHATVAVAPSATGLLEHRRAGVARLLVGVGDGAAPLVEHEVTMISHETEGDDTVLLGAAGCVADIGQLAPQHDVIHVACHGQNRADNPWLSSLQVADGHISALDIAAWPLSGQLVVLSACSSGRQHGRRNADELLGLPRGFLAAGASEVLVNLWPVSDKSASELMAEFHRHLGAGQVPSSALRAAQLAVRAARPHPYHWAPAVLYTALSDPFDPLLGESS